MSFRSALRRVLPSAPPHHAARGGIAAALRRPAALTVATFVVLALLAGAAAWSLTAKTVALSVDGVPQSVDLRGSTVAHVLSAAGLEAGEHDLVVPTVESPVADGDRVELRRGRPLTLVVDGQQRIVWVTAASVDEALDQIGLRQAGLALSASRSRPIPLEGLQLEVRTPKSVNISVDGGVQPLISTAATVGDLLAEAGVTVGPVDRVTPAVAERVTEGLQVGVARVSVEPVEETAAVPFAVERRDDDTLAKGRTKVLQAGKQGTVTRVFTVTTVDGTVEGRQLVSETTAAPVTQILAVGTLASSPSVPASSASSASSPRAATGDADSLNWPALANCESGGNPRSVSSGGTYRGLYQFSMSTWSGVGGSGDPIDASADEQTYRAKVLYNRSGAGQWPNCGRYLFS